ncbi:unnamed protein product, partial [Vitis vinifera]
MEKNQGSSSSKSSGPQRPSQRKMIGAKAMRINEDEGARLVGSIVEKGISGKPPAPSSAPQPTVLPFPVARHRSHGPHWSPFGSKMGGGNDKKGADNSDSDDGEDMDLTGFDQIAAFANPIERKQKKGLDLSNWRELMSSYAALADADVLNPKEMNVESGLNSVAANMELDKLDPVPDIARAQLEIVESMRPRLVEVQKNQGQVNMEEQSHMVPGSENFGIDQGSMTLESQIDAENRAQLERMSHEEIAEAQAEIMEKMNPTLLKMLKKRGQDKLKKQKCSGSDLATNGQLHNLQDENQLTQDTKGFSVVENNVALQNSGPGNSGLWNAWSERVEAVRDLRFSWDGTVIENDFGQVSKTDNNSVRSGYNADNVTERDFLRTEGDPGAAGYTIKEALALARSMVPGQRALAYHLLASVLYKALDNIHRHQVGYTMRSVNNSGVFIDWEAVWAYALGPEPELVLALRMSLDDNHNSVVLACAKVIQCVLSCDMNEYFVDVSERLATCEKVVCTAPVFRSRPEIELGFLHGGFWKYNTKPSNIFPLSEDIMDAKSEEKLTIQDDIVVAGQDFAAGLVRMGILPRIRYLLETDPTVALEECMISILIAIARHSPTCANAIIKCERLVQTVVGRFAEKDKMGVYPSKIKSVTLLKVLAQSDKKNCIEFIKSGIFQDATLNLSQCPLSLDQWIKSGKENCKHASALMVEQLRFWKVCIQYGYCVSYFGDFFPAMHLWLNPPTFEKLIENNVLNEFAAITTEAYLVLESLARRLSNFSSQKHISELVDDDKETWSWSHVGPIVNIALKWMAFKTNPDISRFFDQQKGIESNSVHKDLVTPEDTISLPESGGLLPGLPEFVSKIGLEVINNSFLSFPGELCHLRHHGDYEISLGSTCCLHGLVQQVVSLDNLIQLAKTEIQTPSFQGHSFAKEGKVLEDGVLKWSLIELKTGLITFMKLVTSEWHYLQSIEIFGRGGPAPGVGLGWGASGGGFWSKTVLLAQTDAELLIHLLEIFPFLFSEDIPLDEDMTFTIQRINSALEVCLTLGPRNRVTMEKALDILLQVPVLKYLNLCICRFLHLNKEIKQFGWVYQEEDFLIFSKMLASHFRKRWLCVKKKFKAVESKSSSGQKASTKGSESLDTIPEDMDISNTTIQDHDCPSLLVEWAHQRLPLPVHWFLSPISTIHDGKHTEPPSNSNIQNLVKNPTDFLEVARGGLFFLLGIEAMSSFLSSDVPSPVRSVPVIWKLHSLSVTLLDGMSVLEEKKSRDVYEALQELYGQLLDESRVHRSTKPTPETGEKNSIEFLRFQSDIHESYSTFIETLVEQFAAISYGDLIYGRQVAIYLHRSVEAPVRLAAWNALSNARVLELLPPLEKCSADAEGYLEPVENNEGILEAYVKSWVTGALDRAATRGSVTFTLVLHHLSSVIFEDDADVKLSLRNKLAKSLLRDYSRKRQHEGLMLQLLRYNKQFASPQPEWMKEGETEKRFRFLTEACEGNASLLKEVEKLKSSFRQDQ